MNDCSNADIRDQLPDLLHERLDVSARAAVVAHVASCVDCRDELQLLRDVLGMIEIRTPTVDIARIVMALPKPTTHARPAPTLLVETTPAVAGVAHVTPLASRRRRWADWRVAAAVTLLVAGGSSAVLLNRGSTSAPSPNNPALVGAVAPVSPTPSARGIGAVDSSLAAGTTTTGSSAMTADATPAAGSDANGQAAVADPANADLGNGSRLGDLTEAQLQKLLTEIDKLPAIPVTDPEPVSLHVTSQVSSSEGA